MMEPETPYVVETDTAEETYDADGADEVDFLAPRLAAYAPSKASHSDADVGAQDDDNDETSQGPLQTTFMDDDDNEEPPQHLQDDEQATAGAVLAEGMEEEEEEPIEPAVRSSLFDLQQGSASDNDEGDVNLAALLAVSRVRELLKFEGSSAIVAKSAAQAASEAVVLILRDLAKTAAEQATRKKRKTVNYDDVACAAKLYDRFSFLADVLPPSEASAGKAVQVGSGAAAAGGFLRPQTTTRATAPREKKKPAARLDGSRDTGRTPKISAAMMHPMPGEAGMKQTSLRF